MGATKAHHQHHHKGGHASSNILFMLVDDGGFESPVWGNQAIRTPNIAALANRSTIFERAYTAVSSCSPSRSAILTGLPTHQNGMYGLNQAPGNFHSHRDVTSLPNLLNTAGFKTGIIGKHHVGPIPSYHFTYGTNATFCWSGALGNPFVDAPTGCMADYNDMALLFTSLKNSGGKAVMSKIETISEDWIFKHYNV